MSLRLCRIIGIMSYHPMSDNQFFALLSTQICFCLSGPCFAPPDVCRSIPRVLHCLFLPSFPSASYDLWSVWLVFHACLSLCVRVSYLVLICFLFSRSSSRRKCLVLSLCVSWSLFWFLPIVYHICGSVQRLF